MAARQGLDKDERFTSPDSAYNGEMKALAMHACSFYQCHNCAKPYFGGMIDCEIEQGIEESTAKEDLLCKDC